VEGRAPIRECTIEYRWLSRLYPRVGQRRHAAHARQQLNQQFLSFAANLVSFCGEGARKIAPTRFEMRKSGFTSKSDLYVLILERLSN
jgi:hypothetical protein